MIEENERGTGGVKEREVGKAECETRGENRSL